MIFILSKNTRWNVPIDGKEQMLGTTMRAPVMQPWMLVDSAELHICTDAKPSYVYMKDGPQLMNQPPSKPTTQQTGSNI